MCVQCFQLDNLHLGLKPFRGTTPSSLCVWGSPVWLVTFFLHVALTSIFPLWSLVVLSVFSLLRLSSVLLSLCALHPLSSQAHTISVIFLSFLGCLSYSGCLSKRLIYSVFKDNQHIFFSPNNLTLDLWTTGKHDLGYLLFRQNCILFQIYVEHFAFFLWFGPNYCQSHTCFGGHMDVNC